MFETLEDVSERSKRPLHRGWPIFNYSALAVFGLGYLMEGVRRRQPLGAVIGAVVFLLSLTWLITTIRSRTPLSRRDFWVRSQIALWILLAYEIAYTVAAH
jgi:hypothetical protein